MLPTQVPPQPRPRTFGELAQAPKPTVFQPYRGPILGERYGLGNGAPGPESSFVMDVLPLKHDGPNQGEGSYQLVIYADQPWTLVNTNNTLAAVGKYDKSECSPRFRISDGRGDLATLETFRRSRATDDTLQLPGESSLMARIHVEIEGRTYRTNDIGFNAIAGRLRPTAFRLRGRNQTVEFEPLDERMLVRLVPHRGYDKTQAIDERVIPFLARMVQELPQRMGLLDELDRGMTICR